MLQSNHGTSKTGQCSHRVCQAFNGNQGLGIQPKEPFRTADVCKKKDPKVTLPLQEPQNYY